MFNPIVETAIGLAFVYLLLSMVCSAVQEWIAAVFALRAQTLYEGITKMLGGDNNLRDLVFNHPLVDGLSRKTVWNSVFRRPARPSYISAETFAKALVSEANLTNATIPEPVPGTAVPATPTLARNGQPLHQNTQQLIQTLLTVAPSDINGLRRNLEDWYNDGMDRVSGWYKRKTQLIMLILGFLIAVSFNADTIMLAQALWNDPTLRMNTANAAAQGIKAHNPPQDATLRPPSAHGTDVAGAKPNSPVGNTSKTGTTSQPPSGTKSAQTSIASLYPSVTSGQSEPTPSAEQRYTEQQQERAEQQYRDALTNVRSTMAGVTTELQQIKIPLGWCGFEESTEEESQAKAAGVCDAEHHLPPADTSTMLLKLCGLLITTIALSQGAPFWFDLLQKVVNLRLAGDAPDEKKK